MVVGFLKKKEELMLLKMEDDHPRLAWMKIEMADCFLKLVRMKKKEELGFLKLLARFLKQ